MPVKRKRKSARERGYLPIQEVATGLRSLANQLVQDNRGRLAKVTLNVYYEEDDERVTDGGGVSSAAQGAGGGD